MVVVIVSQPPSPSSAVFRVRQSWCCNSLSSSSWSPPLRSCRRQYTALRRLNPLFPQLQRLQIFYSRCSITNTEVFTHVDTDKVHEEFPHASSNCCVPVIHIDSDIPETESLNLLDEDTDVDILLTTLPVLSKEEQNVISATPSHPMGLYAFYASCIAGNLVEQVWGFAWPVAIAQLHPSLLPVAVLSFFSKLAVIVGGPLVGKLMDRFPRVPSYNCLSVVQAAAQLLSAGIIIHAHANHPSSEISMLPHSWFSALVLAGGVERLCGLALGVAVERDWVVLLAGTNRPIALAKANAVLSRIDLLCESAGALLFGFLLSKYEPVTCLKFAASLMTATLPVVVFLTWLANKLSSGVLERAEYSETSCRRSKEGPLPCFENIVDKSAETIKNGWGEYMQQPVLPASIAYVLLYFNVVLAPGGLMTAFLTQSGIHPSIIGGFSALCAFMGVAATLISTHMVKQLGILKAGAVGLVLQASLLCIAVAVYFSGYLTGQTPVLLFLVLIVLSRLGHMVYDVIGTQILQTGIPASKANLIGTTEVSMASLAESVMLGVVIVVNDVSHFGLLVMLSLFSVVGAACLFCRWLQNPTDAQLSLLYSDPILLQQS